jgi:integrase
MAASIRQRHSRHCKRRGRCNCPYEAFVYSKREGKKVRRTFPTRAEAMAWREGSGGNAVKSTAVPRNDLQEIVEHLAAAGRSACRIVAAMHLRAIDERPVVRGEVAVNSKTELAKPAIRDRRDRIATPEECAGLLAALLVRDRPLWATAMYAGLRRQELMALRVEDVDLATGLIRVCRVWDREEGVSLTRSGKERRVPIAAVLRDYLDEHLLRLKWSEGLLFGSSAVRPFGEMRLRKRALAAWTKAGLEPITLHECRHTFASLMIAAGVNAKAISTYMGHANIWITVDRYGHLMPGSEDVAAELLDAYLVRASLAPVPPRPGRIQSGPIG